MIQTETSGVPPQSRHPLVLAVVAVVLCLVVVGFLLTRRGDDPATASTPTHTTVATQSPTTDSGSGDGVLTAPAVVANPKVGSVEFTWSYSGAKSTDTYRVHVGTNVEDAQIADPITLPKATYSVKVRSGSPACLIAIVVRSGETSAASPAVCGTAR